MEERKIRKKKEKAISEKNYEQIYTYSKDLADLYLKFEEYEQALTEYKEAEVAAKKLNNKLYIAIANRMIGEALCFLGEFEEALVHQKIHLNFSREENNLIEEQRALATLGRTYFVKAESFTNEESDEKNKCLELSRKYYLKSLNICDRLSSSSNLGQKQLSEMKARLYLNLGLTLESKGDVNSGIEYVAKAINICKHLELWEDLCRCYIAQGSLYMRHNDTPNAIFNYDEALKISERVESRILLSCEILSLKADVLIELLDFTGAKQILVKAYKLKTPDMKERKEIEKKLKILVMICRTETKLLEISENDLSSKKNLNETLGDCCVKLKSYKKAIDCYHKMLECSEAMGLTDKELIASYFSLSQTYKDAGLYDLALKYFEKEYEIEKNNPIEACKTLLNIIELLESQKKSLDVIMEKYQQALSLAKKVGDFKTEAAVLRNMISFQKQYGRDDLALETQKELDVILCCISDEDSDDKAEVSDEEMDFDIDLEELSDLNSDNEDDTANAEKHTRRKTTKSFLIRRNEKGETPLHVASAKGNIQLVKSLLKQGHPVNVPDAAGWSPLHEACNHGQVEVAKVLIDAGANIDDRGGPECDGITPLHDAAACGHLEVMEMLLDNGASPLARTNQDSVPSARLLKFFGYQTNELGRCRYDLREPEKDCFEFFILHNRKEGETALDCLLACKQRVVSEEGELDPITSAHFHSVVTRLQNALDKVGYTTKKSTPQKNNTDIRRSQSFHDESRISQRLSKTIESSRKRASPGNFEDESTNAAEEYQNAIQALRHRNKKDIPKSIRKSEKPKIPALVTDEVVGDDWLEDDLGDVSKRPAKRRCEQFVGQQLRATKPSFSSQSKKTSSTPIKSRWDDAFDDIDLDELDNISTQLPGSSKATTGPAASTQLPVASTVAAPPEFPIIEDTSSTDDDMNTRIVNKNRKLKPKYQKSLLSIGFKRFTPHAHSTQQSEPSVNSRILDPIESPSHPTGPSRSQNIPNTQGIKVRVEGKLFLVPLPNTQEPLNIKWLISEASRRYQNLEGVSPVLSLTTEDGALLDENDPISLVLGNNEVHATVMSWNLAPLVDRYKEACSASNIEVDDYIALQLDICQASACFEIKNVPIQLNSLMPALKAISYYQNLQRISLPGVFLRDQGFKAVVDSIMKLVQLRSLDVSCNNITAEGLSYFVLILNKNTSLQDLEEIDFSYNPLGEESVHQLTNVTHHLIRLRILNLKHVGLTAQSLYGAANFNLEYVERLDLSGNHLEREGASKFLSSLDSNRIRSIDMSHTGGSEAFRECLLFLDRGHLDSLETLKLADLEIDDNDVEQLIQSLKQADQLSLLDLSGNMKITSKSHPFLSELKNLKELNLAGCELLTVPHELVLPFCALAISSEYNENDFRDAPYSLILNKQVVF